MIQPETRSLLLTPLLTRRSSLPIYFDQLAILVRLPILLCRSRRGRKRSTGQTIGVQSKLPNFNRIALWFALTASASCSGNPHPHEKDIRPKIYHFDQTRHLPRTNPLLWVFKIPDTVGMVYVSIYKVFWFIVFRAGYAVSRNIVRIYFPPQHISTYMQATPVSSTGVHIDW